MERTRANFAQLVSHDGLTDSLTGLISFPAFLESGARFLASASRDEKPTNLFLLSLVEPEPPSADTGSTGSTASAASAVSAGSTRSAGSTTSAGSAGSTASAESIGLLVSNGPVDSISCGNSGRYLMVNKTLRVSERSEPDLAELSARVLLIANELARNLRSNDLICRYTFADFLIMNTGQFEIITQKLSELMATEHIAFVALEISPWVPAMRKMREVESLPKYIAQLENKMLSSFVESAR